MFQRNQPIPSPVNRMTEEKDFFDFEGEDRGDSKKKEEKDDFDYFE